MATGHILPGYGNPVTRLRRAQTAYPLDKQKLHELAARNVPDLDPRTLDHIRENARNMWLRPNYDPTTYNTFYTGDQLDAPTEPQPTEPMRRHKPHPKPVFLINRLHYVPGYHNADATMGKPVYQVDDTFPEEERQLRRHQREKFVARPRSAAVDQYRDPWAPLTEAVGPVEAWGAQAWLKTADDDHQHEVVNAIRDYRDKELFNTSRSPVPPPIADATPRPYTAIPSMHRWMKNAGATESEHVRRILYGGYPPSTIQPLGSLGKPATTLQRKQQEIDNVRKTKYSHINKYPRGDFLIHPEYPPTFPHHRID